MNNDANLHCVFLTYVFSLIQNLGAFYSWRAGVKCKEQSEHLGKFVESVANHRHGRCHLVDHPIAVSLKMNACITRRKLYFVQEFLGFDYIDVLHYGCTEKLLFQCNQEFWKTPQYSVSHLAKWPSDVKQNGTQEKTPFSGTVFNTFSHGVLCSVASGSFKNH